MVSRFNWKLVVILVVTVILLSVTALGLREWQKNRMALGRLTSGSQAYNARQWEKAAQDLGKYLVAVPDDVDVLLKYANAQLNIRPLKRKNIQHAISTYRAVLRLEPQHAQAARKLVELYLQMGMYGESELIARRQLETVVDPNLQRMLVVSLVAQRKFKETAHELEQIIKSRPDDILAYEAMSQLCDQRPEQFSQEPVYWLDLAVKANADSALAYVVRGAYFLEKNQRDAAIADFNSAQHLDLSDSTSRLRLARELLQADQLETARAHLEAITKLNPRDVDVWQVWAMYAIKTNSKPEMLRVAQTGLDVLGSEQWDYMPIAAELFIDCQAYDRAVDCLNKLDGQDVAPANVAFLRGLLAERQGRGFTAVAHYRQAIQLGNKTSRLRMTLAQTLANLGDQQSAIQQMRLLVSEQPDLIEARNYLSSLLLQSAEAQSAAEQAQEAIQYAPGNNQAKAFYAQALIQQLNPKAVQRPLVIQIEKILSQIEADPEMAHKTQMLKFQFAMQTGNYTNAQQCINQLAIISPDNAEIDIARVDLMVAINRLDDAKAFLTRLMEKDTKAPMPVRYMATILANSGKFDESTTLLATALTRMQDQAGQRQLGLLLCDHYRQAGKKQDAYKVLDQLDKKLMTDISVKRKLLTFEIVVEDASRADNLIKQIKAAEGQEGWQWRYEQAKLWFVLKSFKEHVAQIIALLEDNLRANPEDQESRLLLAMTYDRAGDLQLAIKTYDDALNRSPKDLRVIIPAVAALYKAKKYDQADRILAQAEKENLNHPILSGYEMQRNLRYGQLDSASDILSELKSNDPNNQSLDVYLAMVKMRQKDYDGAEKILDKLAANKTHGFQIAAAKVELNLRKNRPQEAVKLCNDLVAKTPTAQAYLLRAKAYDIIKMVPQAEQDFEMATKLDPNDAESLMAKSEFYYNHGRIEPAAAAAEAAVLQAPDNPAVLKQSLMMFLQSGNATLVNRGLKILDKALAVNPADAELQTLKVRTLLNLRTAPALQEATRMLQNYTESRPSDIQGWSLLCQCYLDRNDPAQAIDTALRGLVYIPENRTLLMLKARAEAARSPELAIPTLNVLHSMDPNDTESALYLAGLHVHKKSYPQAIELLSDQLKRTNSSDASRVKLAMAVAMYKNGQKDDAVKIFDAVGQADPNDSTVIMAQASLLKDEQKYTDILQKVNSWYKGRQRGDDVLLTVANDLSATPDVQARKTAEDILRAAISEYSKSPQIFGALAKVLYLTGKNVEAAEMYSRQLAMEPNDLVAMNNLAWILCEEQGQHQKALDLTLKGLAISPDYLDLLDTRGIAYFRLGRYDKAAQDLTKCAQLYPGHVPSAIASYFHLGRALAALGQKDEAVKYLKMALESNGKIGGLSASDVSEAQNLLNGLIKESKS